MAEKWLPIKGVPHYAISSLGRVKALDIWLRFVSKGGRECWRFKKERLISQNKQNGGYLIVHLYKDDKRVAKTVHSLVAAAFIGTRPKGLDVCHKDGVRTHNHAKNLEYGTRSKNLKEMIAHGTCPFTNAKLSPKDVVAIRKESGTYQQISDRYGISVKQYWRIKSRKNWGHIK